ncbi:MAG: hypothetical protein ABFS02_07880 [Pseudomonadota bacterium]
MIMQLRPEYRVTILLSAACVLFALVIAAEWAANTKYVAGLNSRLSEIGGDTGLLPESFPNEEIILPPVETYAEIVERPLFLSGRRPMEEQALSADASDQVFTGKLNIQLMGVISVPQGMMVLFVDPKGEYSRAEQDDTIEGWRVKEVQFDRVVLEQGGVVEELLLRKPKPKASRRPRTKSASTAKRRASEARKRRRRERRRVDQDD